jgi:hypothetical protein
MMAFLWAALCVANVCTPQIIARLPAEVCFSQAGQYLAFQFAFIEEKEMRRWTCQMYRDA